MLKRIIVGAILTVVLVAVLMLGGWVQCAFITAAAVIAVYELKKALAVGGIKLFTVPLYVYAALYGGILRLWGIRFTAALWFVCVIIVCGERIFNKNRTTEESLYTLGIMVYPMSLFTMLSALGETGNFDTSRILFLSAFALPLIGDVVAYFVGSFLGKRKLCPDISPKKTVAGSVGGVIGGALGGIAVYFVQRFYPAGIGLIKLAVMGLICGAAGQIGDLFASVVKRMVGIKDYGKLFPGHGGVMDRFDSVLLCAPIIYFVFTILP